MLKGNVSYVSVSGRCPDAVAKCQYWSSESYFKNDSKSISIYRTRTKFRELNFRVAISNYIRGSLFSWGVNFRGRTPNFVLKYSISDTTIL